MDDVMADIFDDTLMAIALGGLAVSLVVLAFAAGWPYIKAAWDRASKFARAVFCLAAAGAVMFGGAKHRTGGISYPKTDNEIAYLTDAGSYVTNDAVHVAFTRVPTVPDTATFYLDYCALDGTNEQGVATNWVNAKTATFGELEVPFDFAFANATNYNWLAYTDWTPGPAVQTNGVWHAYWGIDKKEGRYFIPVRTCVRDGGSVIATPKSKWDAKDPMELTEAEAYERYAPDTAIVLDLDLLGTNTVTFTPASMGSKNQFQVYWGDGSYTNGNAGYWGGYDYTHTYAKRGRYVLRFPPTVAVPWGINDAGKWKPGLVRVLRWGDNINFANMGVDTFTVAGATNLKGPIPRWPTKTTQCSRVYQGCTSLTGEVPAWPTGLTYANSTYYGCTGLTGAPADWSNCTALTYANSTYYGCTGLTGAPADWSNCTALTYANSTYYGCTGLTGAPADWSNCTALTSAERTYQNCKKLTGEVPAWPPNLTRAGSTFEQCAGLTGTIKAWPSTLTQTWGAFYGCKNLTGAWTSDPAELMPTNITSHGDCVSGSSDALRALFYSDWGGTRTKTE